MVQKSRGAEQVFHAPFLAADFDAGKDLFVNAPDEEKAWSISEEARDVAAAFVFLVAIDNGQAESQGLRVPEMFEEGRVLIREKFFISIENKNPIAGGMLKNGIPGGAEVIGPCQRMDFGAEFARDFQGAIAGAGIAYEDLAGDGADGSEAGREETFFILGDQAHGQFGGGLAVDGVGGQNEFGGSSAVAC